MAREEREMRERKKRMQFKIAIMRAFKNGLLFFSILLIACQGVQRTVAPEDRISLRQGGPHTGNWESKVKTQVQYDGIKVHVLFVDPEGKVLVRKEVAVYRLDNTFEIPPETTFISFQANTYRRPVIYSPPTHR